MVNMFHWKKEDYFPYLTDNFKSAVLALEYLVDDLHVNKDKTIRKFLSHVSIDIFIVGIIKLMASDNLRVSGNSAYVFGTIAETPEGIDTILNLLNNKSQPESNKVLSYLVKLLQSSDYECMMNAAGTIGTISENNLGRSWLIQQPLLDKVIELSTELLDNSNIWVSSNAALVIARITIEEDGCEKILKHTISNKIMKKMIESLGSDNAGRGMNCAFAIGRICDTENGRIAFLENCNVNCLIESLFQMIQTNSDNGCTKNACYTLSCLAANQKAYELIINNNLFNSLLDTLCKILTTVKDPETQWFSAMLLRIFSSFPSGCIKIKKNGSIKQTLSEFSKKRDLNEDVREEINIIIETLKPIEKPNSLVATMLGPTSVRCEWKPVKSKSSLTINYLLYQNRECVFNGPNLFNQVNNLEPFTEYKFTVQAMVVEDGEKSEFSDEVMVRTDESIPSEPENLRVTGSTTNIIRLAWDPPSKPNGIIKFYFVYNGETLVDQTADSTSTIPGLQADTSYDIYVCASTIKGKGEKAYLEARTCNLGDILPEKPTFGMIGRREILVRWQPPQVISGKLTRYELLMNSKCVYSGIMHEYQVVMLKPDNEYKFEVMAITTEGKFKSKAAKVRTLKDEYDPERTPLYPGPLQAQAIPNPTHIREKLEPSPDRKKSSLNENPRANFIRSKTKPKILKEILPTMVCEEIDINQVKKMNRNTEGFLTDSSIFTGQNSSNNYDSSSTNSNKPLFPPLSHLQSNNYYTKNEIFKEESISQMERPTLTLNRGKTDLKRNLKQALDNTSRMNLQRSKTMMKMSPYLKKSPIVNQSPIISQSVVQPTIFAFSLKEMTPKFPIIPLVTAQSLPNSSCSTDSDYYSNPNSVPSVFQVKNNFTINKSKQSNDARLSAKSIDKKSDSDYVEYQYLINKINKSKALDINDNLNNFIRSNTYVNR